jgi:DNA polymerase-3 subunit chi
MTEIQFYHLTSTPLERALPKLLEKALQGGFRTLVLMGSDEKAEAMNDQLWVYDAASFLPHGTAKDGSDEDQPIYLSTKAHNPNHADLLVVTDGSELEFDPTLKRVLDIFDGTDDAATANARKRWKKYQSEGHQVTYVKQTAAGSWEKQAA